MANSTKHNVFDPAPSAPLCENMSSTKPTYKTYCTVIREGQATVTAEMYKKIL